MKNSNEPAFLRPYSRDEFSGDSPESHWASMGLTKRELFAAMAMQGLCESVGYSRLKDFTVSAIALAENALYVADAMLAELDK